MKVYKLREPFIAAKLLAINRKHVWSDDDRLTIYYDAILEGEDEPFRLDKVCGFRIWDTCTDHPAETIRPGYLIQYVDDYVSWMAAGEFERAFYEYQRKDPI